MESHKGNISVCKIVCISGQFKPIDLRLKNDSKIIETWTFGRGTKINYQLNVSNRISNMHFKIIFNKKDLLFYIIDTSTNGTFLNNVKLVKNLNYILKNRDEISIGNGVSNDTIRLLVLTKKIYISESMKHSEKTVNKNESNVHKDFIISEDIIGQGAFANVKKAIERSTGESFAVKIISRKKDIFNTSDKFLTQIYRELTILKKLNHQNVISLKSFYEERDFFYFIIELVPNGDLMKYVMDHGSVSEDDSRQITEQVLNGISYFHSLGISHRDLKPENILIVSFNPIMIKISDFGLAKITDNFTFMKSFCGTLAYIAPEIIENNCLNSSNKSLKKYSCLIDIWSLGCSIYVILTKMIPFGDTNQKRMIQRIKSGSYHHYPLDECRLSNSGKDFLKSCFEINPQFRISAEKALKHDWIKNIKTTDQLTKKTLNFLDKFKFENSKFKSRVKFNFKSRKVILKKFHFKTDKFNLFVNKKKKNNFPLLNVRLIIDLKKQN